jgi:ABC-type transport system substrate-binding protein
MGVTRQPGSRITRRQFLMASGVSVTAISIGACTAAAPPTATPGAAVPGATTAPVVATSAPAAPPAAPSSRAAAPKTGGTLVVAHPNDGEGFDPATSIGGPTGEAEAQVYEGLVRYKPSLGRDLAAGTVRLADTIEPALAESWGVAPDNVTYTFKLRQGVKFHDGTPFNADAVILNIDRQLNENNPYYFKGQMRNAAALYEALGSYRAVDPMTVELKLKYPYYPFLGLLATANAGIISPTALQKHGLDIAKNLVGTGPFRFSEWRPGDTLTFVRNTDWWGGTVYLDKLVLRTIPEPAAELAALQAGEVDLAIGIAPDAVQTISKDPNVHLDIIPAGFNGYEMRCDRPPFNDKRVRQAMTYAIDRQTINDTLFQRLGVVANSPLPAYIAEWDKSPPVIPYDPEKAKSLLAAAGYANGFDFRLVTFNGSLTTNPAGGSQEAEAVQPYLAKVGVNAKIEALDIGAWRAKKAAGDFDMETDGREGQSADGILYPAYHSSQVGKGVQNNAYYPDPQVDKLLEAGRSELDPAKRKTIYAELQKYLMDLSLWVYINYVPFLQAYKTPVMDVALDQAFSVRAYRTVWINT